MIDFNNLGLIANIIALLTMMFAPGLMLLKIKAYEEKVCPRCGKEKCVRCFYESKY